MKKKFVLLTLTLAIAFSLVVPAFAALQQHPSVRHEFYTSISTSDYEFEYSDIGTNEQDYTCAVPNAHYEIKLFKKRLMLMPLQIGATYNFLVNKGKTYCARWEDANADGGKFYFSYYPKDNSWDDTPYTSEYIKGTSIYLSEN